MALTNGDLQKIGSLVDTKLSNGFKEFGKEFDKQLTQQRKEITQDLTGVFEKRLSRQRVEIKNEWYDLFAEAFQGMINPMFKTLGKDIKGIKGDITGIKKDIQGLRYSVDTIERKLDKFDDKLWAHQESIDKLEEIHPAGKHAIAT